LTFKADIDDLRESPAVGIAQQVIQDALGDVIIVEPHIRELPVQLQADNALPNSSIRAELISNPTVVYFFPNSTAKGSPT
jgi:UDP-N-acetyl-D-mannosaminuronic acid dehydrogenase